MTINTKTIILPKYDDYQPGQSSDSEGHYYNHKFFLKEELILEVNIYFNEIKDPNAKSSDLYANIPIRLPTKMILKEHKESGKVIIKSS